MLSVRIQTCLHVCKSVQEMAGDGRRLLVGCVPIALHVTPHGT